MYKIIKINVKICYFISYKNVNAEKKFTNKSIKNQKIVD